jgi:hypothetical protein
MRVSVFYLRKDKLILIIYIFSKFVFIPHRLIYYFDFYIKICNQMINLNKKNNQRFKR